LELVHLPFGGMLQSCLFVSLKPEFLDGLEWMGDNFEDRRFLKARAAHNGTPKIRNDFPTGVLCFRLDHSAPTDCGRQTHHRRCCGEINRHLHSLSDIHHVSPKGLREKLWVETAHWK